MSEPRPHRESCYDARERMLLLAEFEIDDYSRDMAVNDGAIIHRNLRVTVQWHIRRADEERVNDWRQLMWIQKRYFYNLTECSA